MLLSAPTVLALDANLLLNPGFEDDLNGDNVPDNWSVGAGTASGCALNQVTPGETGTFAGNLSAGSGGVCYGQAAIVSVTGGFPYAGTAQLRTYSLNESVRGGI